MARLALRQFLRSSFDPGDKTMASPIIACLGAATLLILASCSFASITATDLDDYSEEDRREEPNHLRKKVRPLEPVPRLDDTQGFVRTSNYSGGSPRDRPPVRQTGSGSRSLPGGGVSRGSKEPSKGTPKDPPKDYLGILGDQALLVVDIAAKQLDKGVVNIAANIEKHENGGINVRPQTAMGKTVGILALKYLKKFFKNRWVGVLAHIAQEAVDRFIAGAEIFFSKTSLGKLL